MHALIPLLADGGGHSHWWIVFPIFWALLLVSLLVLFARRCRPAHWGGGDPAAQILGERFARGEIEADEYRRRLEQLRSR